MCTASLLGNAEYQAKQQAGAQSEDREPATALVGDEVQGHECIARTGVRRRKTLRVTQLDRSGREQLHVRKRSSERLQIPGAIDIRDGLEQSNDADCENDSDYEVSQRSLQPTHGTMEEGRYPYGQRKRNDNTHRPTSACVQKIVDPPIPCAAPMMAGRIKKQGAREPQFDVRTREQQRCCKERC